MKLSSGSSSVGRAKKSYLCFCSLPAPIKTSWTEDNPGRRFWGCASYNSRVSSFMVESIPLDNLNDFLLTVCTSKYRQNLMPTNFSNGWTNQPVQHLWRS
jgi:hypothetical protein